MVNRRLTRAGTSGLLFAAALLACGSARATEYSITTIDTRPGITVPLMIIDKSADTPAPVGTLILFSGGNGQLGLLTNWPSDQSGLMTYDTDSSSNFLVRQRNNFAAAGFNVILIDVPSDQASGYPASPSFRRTAKHQKDIAAVIDYARTTFGLPVWLVGTSRGSTSAIKGALITTQQPTLAAPDGFVVTSTVTKNGDPDDVMAMPLGDIALVAMMVANEQDICDVTPPVGVNRIARQLLASPDFRGKFVTNTTDPVDPTDTCDATGYHGFSNAEGKVVSPITAWIIGHLP